MMATLGFVIHSVEKSVVSQCICSNLDNFLTQHLVPEALYSSLELLLQARICGCRNLLAHGLES